MDLIRSGRTIFFQGHLWFVLTDPAKPHHEVVIVMVVSLKPYSDPTLALQRGDHEFIEHPSAVAYSTAKKVSVQRLVGRIQLREDMSSGLLARVRNGLLTSPFTVAVIRNYCEPLF